MSNRSKLVLIPVLLLLAHLPALAGGIDCGGARTPLEKKVCGDPKLLALDRQMADLYDSLQRTVSDSDRTLLAAEQQYWIAERDRNWQRSAATLKRWYRHRIADLQLKAGIVRSADPYLGIYIVPHDVWVTNDNERETMQVTDFFRFARGKRDSTALDFEIKSSCPNYHTCELIGTARFVGGRYDYRDIADTDACKLEITPDGAGVLIETKTMNYCKGYCGETCSLDLTHLRLRKVQAVTGESDIK